MSLHLQTRPKKTLGSAAVRLLVNVSVRALLQTLQNLVSHLQTPLQNIRKPYIAPANHDIRKA
jgi:hypothetical protein